MLFSQSQFYDIVQYAKSKNLDPKIFKHETVKKLKGKNFWGKEVDKKLTNPYSLLSIKDTEYYFKVEVHLFDSKRYDNILKESQTYSKFGDKRNKKGEKYPYEHDIYFYIKYSPGAIHFHTIHKRVGLQDNFNWSVIYEFAKLWVNNLIDEIHAIESLARINMIPDFFSTHRTYNEESYSGSQGTILKEKIKVLKAKVNEEIQLNDEQSRIINEKLDELILKVDKINKFDFRTLFFGILTNIASSILYDNAPQFWNIVKNIFGNVLIGSDNTELLI